MNQTQRAINSIKNDSLAALYGKYHYDEDLNAEYHERALLANQKRFYKRPERKGDKGKSDKGLTAELFDWDDESISSKDEGTTKFKAFMEIVEDEPLFRKGDARSGQWVDITMKKRNNLVNKFNALKLDLALHKSELCNLKNTVSINCSFQNEVIRVHLENESLKDEISDLKKVIEKWTYIKVTLDQLLFEKYLAILSKPLEEREENTLVLSSNHQRDDSSSYSVYMVHTRPFALRSLNYWLERLMKKCLKGSEFDFLYLLLLPSELKEVAQLMEEHSYQSMSFR
nr:hypothetical protein [Tanacetum cinerariifolium]